MFEVHIVNSNILTSKNLFLFFEMARVKLTVWFLVPLSVLRLRVERLGFFHQDGGHIEGKAFRCHNLGMMVRKSGTFLDMNKCINRPLKLKRFRDQKWNNFAYILNGVMLKLVSKELCNVCKQVRKKILIYIYWDLRLSHIHVNFSYQMEL